MLDCGHFAGEMRYVVVVFEEMPKRRERFVLLGAVY
jgi:hypothetical protein